MSFLMNGPLQQADAQFIFYDTETTGTDTTFDQILQFAAILTDADLKRA
ncbi:Exonuclease [Roseovarius marisflavi]|uniref:Exonuclease n=1 Tax=Roseovarius marisflavi TaxID=1054996 RepID=A0A1M7CLZ0_9RHOB|nr:exonuclease domain-containing protein [Roseovarius marisflavi]SHL68298.1 Exonuclease [Roseovarius marisflavi]